MDRESRRPSAHDVHSSYQSSTFDRDVEIRVHETVGSASVSPSGRDVVLASAEGLHIVDLDSPYTAPRYLSHQQQWPPADVQWSPFASRDYWIVSTSNQKALVWNLDLYCNGPPIQHTLHAHDRAITDINFSAHHPDLLATCAVDSFVHCWDLRRPAKPVISFADWNAGATQVKWNRQDENILASSHDKFLYIWDKRKGAYPLKKIEAHNTKIYGLDWNRMRAHGIVTCSLDRSIKFWDYSRGDDKPERVIRTEFPVWRARHTPFGWGVLALPQRGDNDLHMYDRRLSEGTPRVGYIDPVHSFSGHQSNVKEFLWRSRGSIEHGVDDRDFQLISWGMDRVLHLHRVDPSILKSVGYEKGKEMRKVMPITRQGAEYKTFNATKPLPPPIASDELPAVETKGLLGKLVTAAGMSKMPLPLAAVGREQASMTYSGKLRKRTADPIKWMSGVTMRSRSDTMSKSHLGLDNPESLKDEITTVSQKYTKVEFEVADVHGRTVKVNLNGPWGPGENSAFLRVNFEFPGDYPSVSPAICTLEKTAAGISDEMLEKLSEEMKSIIDHYQGRKMGCLEAVITYLLGERGLEESITLPRIENAYDLLSPPGDSSSEDEDDAADGNGPDLEVSAESIPGALQANVPLPKGCGAYWSHDGRLVCFFPPKPIPKPIFSLDGLRPSGGDKLRGHRHYEGFGRLQEESPGPRRRNASFDDEDADSTDSWTSSSSSSSDDSYEDVGRLPSRFHPPAAWRAATLRVQKTSSHSGSGGGLLGSKNGAAPLKNKSIITMYDLSHMLPTKRELAEEYMIFGSGPEVCAHNAAVCRKYGSEDYATTWEICRHLLFNKVPLEVLEQKERKEPILIEAKRQMVRVRRKDSGLDLAFDEPESVARPKLTGRVKWGGHPFGSAWLIPELFEHYERLADIQMLAMLSCIFGEPAAREGICNVMAGIKAMDLPIAMQAPAFSLDYFPSADVAWSHFESQRVQIPTATPKGPRPPGPSDYFDHRVTTYGSAGSSNGPWGADSMASGPQTPYSTGETPPGVTPSIIRSHRNSTANSFSSSPEQSSNRSARRTNSNLSAAFSLSKAFTSLSTSPATQERFKAAEADLSTSLPTAPIASVTWGSTTFYSSNSSASPGKKQRSQSSRRRSSLKAFGFDGAYDSIDEEDGYETDDSYYDAAKVYTPTKKKPEEQKIKVTLKNQNLFDTEGHASIPLLPPEELPKRHAYREVYAQQLGAWDLHVQAAEILKFNGMVNYWRDDSPIYSLSEQLEKGPESVQSDDFQSQEFPPNPPVHIRGTFEQLRAPRTIIRTNSSASQAESMKDSPRAPSRPLSDIDDTGTTHLDTNWTTYKLSKPRLDLGTRVGRKSIAIGGNNCYICLERIQGLSVSCARAVHHVHAMCYTEYLVGRNEEDLLFMDVSCGCPIPEPEPHPEPKSPRDVTHDMVMSAAMRLGKQVEKDEDEDA